MSMDTDGLERLQQNLSECVSLKDYDQALQICPLIELEIAEQFSPLSESDMQFYIVYMAISILSSDYNGARYLWRRAPAAIKFETSQFASLWNIAKSLLQQDVRTAFSILNTTAWESNIIHFVLEISAKLRQNYMTLLAKSYSKISAQKIALALAISPGDVSKLHSDWTNDGSGFIFPVNLTPEEETVGATGIEDSLRMMKELSDYVAHMETKSLSVDLVGKPAAEAGAAASAGPSKKF